MTASTAGVLTPACLDNEGRLQNLPRCHDASRQRLKGEVRGGLDFILRDAPQAVIEWVMQESGDCGGGLALSYMVTEVIWSAQLSASLACTPIEL